MGYDFFLGRLLLPVPPQKLQTKISGKNETVTLINDGEVNILKKAGLTELSFTALLPSTPLPFAQYEGGFVGAVSFLEELERLMTAREPFQFIVSRTMPEGEVLFDTNLKVSLEGYTVSEDVKSGFDVLVDISLKQYKDYATRVVEIKQEAPHVKAVATVEKVRPAPSPPQKSHTVVKGDCLWNIAQSYLGDGNRFKEIYELNKSVIDGKNKGTGNTRYTIYPKQVFKIP